MLKIVFLALSLFLAPFCNDAMARPTRSQSDISEMRQERNANIFGKLSRKIPLLLGSSANALSYIPRSDRDCSATVGPGGKFRCKDYTSSVDGSTWTVASGSNAMEQPEIHLFKAVAGGRSVKYAIVHVVDRGESDTVTTLTREATETYAAASSGERIASGRANGRSQSQNPLEEAAQELERALGTAVPGKALPPLKLPSFGR